MNAPCAAILLGAGRSRRLGFDKILSPLAGRPVLQYALAALLEAPEVAEIVLVTRADVREAMQRCVDALSPAKPVRMVEGGEERQDSVWNGLQAVSAGMGLVLIHDAARPLLDAELVRRMVEAGRRSGAAAAGRPCTDTLKQVASGGVRVESTLDRSRVWLVETPQVFARERIVNALRQVREQGVAVTDDASAVEHMGGLVEMVESGRLNLKITRPQDWEVLEVWLRRTRGGEMRQAIHRVANALGPLVGYLPLLARHGQGSEAREDYLGKALKSSEQIREAVAVLQSLAREIHPDPR